MTENVQAVVDYDQIVTKIKNNPRMYVTRDIAEILYWYLSHVSVVQNSETLGYTNRCDVWEPHDLKENTLMAFPSEIRCSNDL